MQDDSTDRGTTRSATMVRDAPVESAEPRRASESADDPLDDFDRREMTGDGATRRVYVAGLGPAVIVLPEMPGISPDVARFARWVRAAGFTVVLHPVASAGLGVVWLAVAKGAGTASLASLAAAAGLPVWVAVSGRPWWEVASAAALSTVVAVRHRGNIERLIRRQERSIR